MRRGDYIIAVNGENSLDTMCRLVYTESEVDLLLIHLAIFSVRIPKQGKPMGLTLGYAEQGLSMVIRSIQEGATMDANVDVQQGDRILSVDECVGVDAMLEKLNTSACPTLLLTRR